MANNHSKDTKRAMRLLEECSTLEGKAATEQAIAAHRLADALEKIVELIAEQEQR